MYQDNNAINNPTLDLLNQANIGLTEPTDNPTLNLLNQSSGSAFIGSTELTPDPLIEMSSTTYESSTPSLYSGVLSEQRASCPTTGNPTLDLLCQAKGGDFAIDNSTEQGKGLASDVNPMLNTGKFVSQQSDEELEVVAESATSQTSNPNAFNHSSNAPLLHNSKEQSVATSIEVFASTNSLMQTSLDSLFAGETIKLDNVVPNEEIPQENIVPALVTDQATESYRDVGMSFNMPELTPAPTQETAIPQAIYTSSTETRSVVAESALEETMTFEMPQIVYRPPQEGIIPQAVYNPGTNQYTQSEQTGYEEEIARGRVA